MIMYKLVLIDRLPAPSASPGLISPVSQSVTGVPDQHLSHNSTEAASKTEPVIATEAAAATDDGDSKELQTKIQDLTDIDSVLSTVPENLQQKSKAILLYLIRANIRVEPDAYRLIYEGDITGSPLSNLLRWTLDASRAFDRPWDQMHFFRLLTNLAVPKSLFGLGKYKLAPVAAKPYLIAVNKRMAESSGGDDNNEEMNGSARNQWRALF